MLLTKEPTNKPDKTTVKNIPQTMAQLSNWNLWKAEKREKEYAKVPYTLAGTRAKANNAREWMPLEKISRTYLDKTKEYGGLTFLLKNNKAHVMVLDIDCHQDAQLITITRVLPVLTELLKDAYIEESPSGNGYHIYFIAEKPSRMSSKYYIDANGIQPKKNKNTVADLEFYDFKDIHTMSVTGTIKGDKKDRLINQQRAFNSLVNIVIPETPKTPQNANKRLSESGGNNSTMTDAAILEKIKNNKNTSSQEVTDLLENGYKTGDDESTRDYKVACELAFYTRDANQIKRIMQASALNREKFNRKDDYLLKTIKKAFTNQTEAYARPMLKSEQQVQSRNIDMLRNANVAANRSEFENYIATKTPATPTKIANLDKALDGGLRSGLYILGAVSSVGKTTLALQIADAIALDRPVLYISMEMSRNELVAKSISRLTKVFSDSISSYSEHDAKTSYGILDKERRDAYNEREQKLVSEATDQYYSTIAKNMYIVEGVGNVDAETIASLAKELRTQLSGKGYDNPAPVVFIDYLQILAPIDPKANDKQATDTNVVELKRLSRDMDVPVFAISSFNRENYNTSVSMTAFKESGAIEYGSDVLLGMQFEGMEKHEITKNGGPKNIANRKWQTEQRMAKNRNIELIVLKNRNGKTGTKVYFEYQTLFNYFNAKNAENEVMDIR